MASNLQTERSAGDNVKLIAAIGLLVAAIAGFYYFAEESLLLRVVGLLATVGVAVAIALQTSLGRVAWGFVHDARTEVRKVVWPTRQETTQVTLMVIVMVIIVGIFLWLLDTFLGWLVRIFTGQGA